MALIITKSPTELCPALTESADITMITVRPIEKTTAWPELSTEDIRFYGEGRIGVHARLAALAAPRELPCEWTQPFRFADLVRPVRYDNRDIKTYLLPGVLQVMDLDEL